MQNIQHTDIIQLAQNLKYMLIGIGSVMGILSVLFVYIMKYLISRLKKLDNLEDEIKLVIVRFDGIESFTKTIVNLDARVTLLERITDRREKDIDGKFIERRRT